MADLLTATHSRDSVVLPIRQEPMDASSSPSSVADPDPPRAPSSVTLPVIAAMDPNEIRLGRQLMWLAVVSGLAMMLPALTAGPLVLDEHGTYWIAGRDNPLSLWERSLKYENIPPLSPFLHRVFLELLGESEWSFRLPSVLCFLLAVWVANSFGRELVGPVVGGLAALVVAWHPNVLGEIRVARCYSLTFLLSTLFFLSTLRWAVSPDSFRKALVWSLLAIGLMWTHYLNLAIVVAAMVVLFWALMGESRKARRGFIFALLAFGAAGYPLLDPLLRMSVWGENFGFQSETSLLEVMSPMWWVGFPAGLVTAWVADRIEPSMSKVRRIRIPRQSLYLMMLWGLVPSVLAAVICRDELASLANPRYRIGFEIAGAMLLVTVLARNRSPRTAVISVVVALVASWSVAERMPWTTKRLNVPAAGQWKQLALHIEKHGGRDESVFVQSGLGEGFLVTDLFEDAVFMDYAACRMGRFYLKQKHTRYAVPFLWRPGLPVYDYFRQVTRNIAESATPTLWVAAATDTDLNRISLETLQELLSRDRFHVTETIRLNDCVLFRYHHAKTE